MSQSNSRAGLKNSKRWVVKIGSSLLTDHGRGLDLPAISSWVEQITQLRKAGLEVVLVSSGSVAEGMSRLGWATRPHELHKLQAAAAVGQMGLIQAYESSFAEHQYRTAQILLTHADLTNRKRYINARSTLQTLLDLGVVPIINENDTVANEELRFGDNDTLGALVANLVEADVLVILTDQDGLFDDDPRKNPDAKLIEQSEVNNPLLDQVAGESAGLGRGGMRTKVIAARLAATSATKTIIVAGQIPKVLTQLHAGEQIGTYLLPSQDKLGAKKQWLAGLTLSEGRLYCDSGAIKALRQQGSSLLSAGVNQVTGHFKRGEKVLCVDQNNQAVASGLINYNADEIELIKQHSSAEIESILGYSAEPELIHRDNIFIYPEVKT